MEFTILQLADLHFSKQKESDISRILDSLCNDLSKIKEEYHIKPDYIFFNGDLITKGDNANEDLNLALDSFIRPVLDFLKLEDNKSKIYKKINFYKDD